MTLDIKSKILRMVVNKYLLSEQSTLSQYTKSYVVLAFWQLTLIRPIHKIHMQLFWWICFTTWTPFIQEGNLKINQLLSIDLSWCASANLSLIFLFITFENGIMNFIDSDENDETNDLYESTNPNNVRIYKFKQCPDLCWPTLPPLNPLRPLTILLKHLVN